VKFLYEVQQRQIRWRWGSESPVFDGVGWLQGLWASKNMVSLWFLLSSLHVREYLEEELSWCIDEPD
jgi:hypothetical protein